MNLLLLTLALYALIAITGTFPALPSAFGSTLTRVLGCTDIGPITTECPLNASIHLQGSGFTGLERLSIQCLVPDSGSSDFPLWGWDARVSFWNETDVFAVISSRPYGYFNTTPGALLTVSYSGGSLPALSFAPQPVVSFFRITGCPITSPDGLSTSQCLPDRHPLTLTGANFGLIAGTWVRMHLRESTWITRFAPLNDSTAVISLSDYDWAVRVEHWDGTPLPFFLDFAAAMTARSAEFSVTFAPLPPPLITNLSAYDSSDGCARNASEDLFTSCLPGRSLVWMWGHYLYDPLEVLIGGIRAAAVPSELSYGPATGWFRVRMPLFDFIPGTLYNITVRTISGEQTLEKKFVFSSDFVLASLEPCVDEGKPSFGQEKDLSCAANSTIRLRVANIPSQEVTNLSITLTGRSPIIAQDIITNCTTARIAGPNLITCILPPVPQQVGYLYSYLWQVVLQYSNSSVSSNGLSVVTYTTPGNPFIFRISGCAGESSTSSSVTSPPYLQKLGQCLEGEVITMTGVNLQQPYGPLTAWVGDWFRGNRMRDSLCTDYTIYSNGTMATCRLPRVEPTGNSLLFNRTYFFQLVYNLGYTGGSNVVALTFVRHLPNPQPQNNPSSSDDNSNTMTVVIATVVPALLILIIAVLCLRKYGKRCCSWSSVDSSISSEYS